MIGTGNSPAAVISRSSSAFSTAIRIRQGSSSEAGRSVSTDHSRSGADGSGVDGEAVVGRGRRAGWGRRGGGPVPGGRSVRSAGTARSVSVVVPNGAP
ncbi:hypothetical protein BRD00_12285 [Halobacteriales archaeon QS_8_69_26]|nr:MAG: hypothetical protein BRD00_12285 [Halobacteriales archaeon QS_8_69_26]